MAEFTLEHYEYTAGIAGSSTLFCSGACLFSSWKQVQNDLYFPKIFHILESKGETMKDRLQAMVLASFVADSLALGVHWIYDTKSILKNFGRVESLLKPGAS